MIIDEARTKGGKGASGLADNPASESQSRTPAKLTDESDWRDDWQGDGKLRDEFGDNEKAYLAYMKANAAGLVRIIEGRTLSGEPSALQESAASV